MARSVALGDGSYRDGWEKGGSTGGGGVKDMPLRAISNIECSSDQFVAH